MARTRLVALLVRASPFTSRQLSSRMSFVAISAVWTTQNSYQGARATYSVTDVRARRARHHGHVRVSPWEPPDFVLLWPQFREPKFPTGARPAGRRQSPDQRYKPPAGVGARPFGPGHKIQASQNPHMSNSPSGHLEPGAMPRPPTRSQEPNPIDGNPEPPPAKICWSSCGRPAAGARSREFRSPQSRQLR